MPFNHLLLAAGLPTYTVVISADRAAWKKSVDAASIPSNALIILRIILASGVVVQATDANASITIDSIFAGSFVRILNSGSILGIGGGGNGAGGGHAIRADFTGELKLTNAAGNIWGGGGGGGQGGECWVWMPGDLAYDADAGGGGGGGGAGGGVGGAGGSGFQRANGNPGTAGTAGIAGIPGTGGNGGDHPNSGVGGNGGDYGVAGSAGTQGSKHGYPALDGPLGNGQVGGLSGFAIKHNVGTTVVWLSGSGAPNVKGSVGT